MTTEVPPYALPAELLGGPVLDADAGWAALMRGLLGTYLDVSGVLRDEGASNTHVAYLFRLLTGAPHDYHSLRHALGQDAANVKTMCLAMQQKGLVQYAPESVTLAPPVRVAVHRVQREARAASRFDAWFTTLSVVQRRQFLGVMRSLAGEDAE